MTHLSIFQCIRHSTYDTHQMSATDTESIIQRIPIPIPPLLNLITFMLPRLGCQFLTAQ